MSQDLSIPKKALIDKLLEMHSDLDSQEMLEKFGIDIHEEVEALVRTKLEAMEFDQILEYL